jgi:hypothetical protein
MFPINTITKEAAILVQVSHLARVTAYIYVHFELSISSVETQLIKYCQLLKQCWHWGGPYQVREIVNHCQQDCTD